MVLRAISRHFGWTILALILAIGLGGWLLERTIGHAAFVQVSALIFIAGPVVSLVITERTRAARPGPVSLVATVIAASVFAWILLGLDASWWLKLLLIAVLAAPVMSVANAAFRADLRRAQSRRDANATRIARAVEAGRPAEPFALYLRPFITTDRLGADALPSDLDVAEVPVHTDVETLLARSLRTALPVLALGRSGDTIDGVARVTTSNDRWRETVEALARNARFIAMVPLSRPGTMWELGWLKQNGLLAKTVFVMPETPHETPSGVIRSTGSDDRIFDSGVRQYRAADHTLDLATEWPAVQRVAEGFDLALPSLAGVGAMFTLDPTTGAIKDIAPLGLSTIARRSTYLRNTLARFGLLPMRGTLPEFIEDYSKAVFYGGRTLEYALIRAADGYIVWGDATTAIRLIKRAVDTGQGDQGAASYVSFVPTLIETYLEIKDVHAARNYVEFLNRLRGDSRLAALVTDDTCRRIAELEPLRGS